MARYGRRLNRARISDIERIRIWLEMYKDGKVKKKAVKRFLTDIFSGSYGKT